MGDFQVTNDKRSNVQTLPKRSKHFLQEQSFWFLIAAIVFNCELTILGWQ